jgi:uncharacterized protein
VAEPRIIIDTGPLVAFLVENEAHHDWAVAQFKQHPSPFQTCEPVLTEAFHLVGRIFGGAGKLSGLLETGLMVVDFSVMSELDSLRRLMAKYADLPMSLADACLVRMAELNRGAAVFTLDGHFRIYRKHGRQQIPVIMPE